MRQPIGIVAVQLVTAAAVVCMGGQAHAQSVSVNLSPTSPQLTAVDPYVTPVNPNDALKPARPFWYSVDRNGLMILRIDDNAAVSIVSWPSTIDVVQPDGSYLNVAAPAAGWEPVGMTVSYPTEEQLASNSETPATYVFVVMAHSGFEWQSNASPPDLRSPNLRDTLVVSTNPATESSMLVQLDVTDPTFSAALPAFGGAVLGHGAGQPAFDPGTGAVYVGNMPSTSLPTAPMVPNDLTSFVSVISGLAPPVVEAGGEAGPPSPPTITIRCGPEHPEEGLLAGVPAAWPCLAEGGEGPFLWEFSGLPSWLIAHPDKLTGVLDGIIYGTPPADGSYTFQVRVTDNGAEPAFTSDWLAVTLNVTPTGVAPEGEVGFEVGVPGAMVFEGTGTCDLAPTASPGSIVPAWIDVATLPGRINPVYPEMTIGCVIMATAPISGEYYEFAMPNFKFAYPWDREPSVISGNVAGPYVFDPVPYGVAISGLAWHQIAKIHDPSTEADILNAEFIGVEPFTGQLWRILLPQGALEVGDVVGPPETSVERDEVSAEGAPLLASLMALRPDITAALAANPNLRAEFGNLAVEVDRDIFVAVNQLRDPTGADPTVIPIGGPAGSSIDIGAVMKVRGTASTIDLPGVQAFYLALDSDLSPGIPGVEPGQVDHGVLWLTGTSTGNVAVVDTALGQYAQMLEVAGAASLGGVSVNPRNGSAYVAGLSLHNVTIFGASAPAPRAPVIWGGTAEHGIEALFIEGVAGWLQVTTTGWPVPTVSYQGTLPTGVTFRNNGNGTGTFSGTPAAGTSAGLYSGTITATNAAGSTSQAFALTVEPPPAAPMITSASTTTFTVGVAGSFTVTSTGGPIPTVSEAGVLPSGVTFTANEDGTATLGGTPAAGAEGIWVLTITATNGTPPDAIQVFTLVVASGTNLAPAITSANAATFTAGGPGSFMLTATGVPTPSLSYAGTLPAGVTFTNNGNGSATLAGMPAIGTEGTYPLTITASNGVPPDATQSFNLTVSPPQGTAPAITLQPASQTVNAGQTATFASAASGNPTPTVQWQRSTDGGVNWSNISGATSTSYTTPSTTTAMNGFQYRAVFTNVAGSVTSNAAILTVAGPTGTAPIVTTQPVSQTVNAGQTATFTAAASGDPTPTVQWERSTDGATWSIITGATAMSYTTPATTTAMSGYRYRAVFTNSIGTAYSNAATLTVTAPPAITAQPVSQTVTAGQTATFTAAASGSPAPTVQWQLSTNGGATWADIPGATSPSYTTPAADASMNGYQYRAVFTNSAGSAISGVATLTVSAQVPTLAVVTTSLPAGEVGQAYSYQLQAQGGSPPYTWTTGARRDLPNGLRLSSAGVISGSPRRAGSYAFVVVVTDAASRTASQTLTLTIAPRR